MILRGRGRSAVADAPLPPPREPGPDAGAGYRTQGAALADRRGQQVRVRASSARPTPGDGDAGGDDQADGRAPARARRRPPRRWVRVRPAAPLDPDRRQRLGTPGRRSTSKRRDCRSRPWRTRRPPLSPRGRGRPPPGARAPGRSSQRVSEGIPPDSPTRELHRTLVPTAAVITTGTDPPFVEVKLRPSGGEQPRDGAALTGAWVHPIKNN